MLESREAKTKRHLKVLSSSILMGGLGDVAIQIKWSLVCPYVRLRLPPLYKEILGNGDF